MLVYKRTIVGYPTGPTFHLRNHQPPCYDQPQKILTPLPLTPITDLLTFSLERTMWRSWGYQTVPMMGRFEIVQPNRLEYNCCSFFPFFWSTSMCVANLVTLPALQIISEHQNVSDIVSFRHFTIQSIMPSPIKIGREGGFVNFRKIPREPYLDKKYSN